MERLLCVLRRLIRRERVQEVAQQPLQSSPCALGATHEEILAAVRRRLELAGVSVDAEGKIVTE